METYLDVGHINGQGLLLPQSMRYHYEDDIHYMLIFMNLNIDPRPCGIRWGHNYKSNSAMIRNTESEQDQAVESVRRIRQNLTLYNSIILKFLFRQL